MRTAALVLVAACVLATSACGSGSTPQASPTTASPCANVTSALGKMVENLKAMTPGSSEARFEAGSALQLVIGHPECFEVETVAKAAQGLAQLNQPKVTVDRPSFFDDWK